MSSFERRLADFGSQSHCPQAKRDIGSVPDSGPGLDILLDGLSPDFSFSRLPNCTAVIAMVCDGTVPHDAVTGLEDRRATTTQRICQLARPRRR